MEVWKYTWFVLCMTIRKSTRQFNSSNQIHPITKFETTENLKIIIGGGPNFILQFTSFDHIFLYKLHSSFLISFLKASTIFWLQYCIYTVHTHTPHHIPKHPSPVQKYPSTRSTIPNITNSIPTTMWAMAMSLAAFKSFTPTMAIT